MTIATEIARIQTAKSDIKAAIEAKGVTVAPELNLDAYPAKIAEITTGGSGGEWTKPADWIDISTVADNEINLLVTEGSGFAFTCTVADSGTFSVDWGDGTIDHNCTSGAVQQHIHTVNGTPWTATGGHTWKVRVYNATAAITSWKIARHTYTNRIQYSPLLWAVVGAQGLIDCGNMFVSLVDQSVRCQSLVRVTIPSIPLNTSCFQMFMFCNAMISFVFPDNIGNVSLTNMFWECSSLVYIVFPDSFTAPASTSTSITSMCYNCISLLNIKLPAVINLNTLNSAFSGCNLLSSIVIGDFGQSINLASMFNGCYSLKNIEGFEKLGSTTTQSNFSDILRDCENLQTPIVCGSLLSKFGAYGAAGYVLKIPSIRLTNPGSTFTGSSPQINVSYTSLDATALENLFTDLPTLTGKTINITGCVGAASLTPTQREIATNKGWTIVG